MENIAQSPCVRNCCLDDNDICLGCFRSILEITQWGTANNQERTAILLNAKNRREASNKSPCGEISACQNLPMGSNSDQKKTMQLNNDFARAVVVNTLEIPWQQEQSSEVLFRMLEQSNSECSRTTSITRLKSGAVISPLENVAGEEIIVFEGTYTDESGEYPAGSYIKNSTATRPVSVTQTDCTLFIKRGHLQQGDIERVVVDTHNSVWRQGMVGGLSVLPLSEFKGEHSALVRWQPGTVFNPHRHWGGEEIYVLDGVFEDEFGCYPAGTWMRSPHLSQHAPFSREGCTIFVKVGHLPEVPAA